MIVVGPSSLEPLLLLFGAGTTNTLIEELDGVVEDVGMVPRMTTPH